MREIPNWVKFAGLGLLVVGGWYWYKNRSSGASATNVPNQYQPPTLQSTDYQSNVTMDNVPWEMTWPYNQLALPYDYTNANAQTVTNNTNFLVPTQGDFVGAQQTVSSG